jgi:hypothetical protein
MRIGILSATTEPDVARRILEWLEMPSGNPPVGHPIDEASRFAATPGAPSITQLVIQVVGPRDT